MFAAIAQKTSWSDKLSFNWFDLALVGVLAFGYWRGRKNGMTKEIFPVLKWICIIAACTFGYVPAGNWLIQSGTIKSVFGTTFKEQTAAYVSAYLVITVVLFIVFSFIKSGFKEKVSGSNTFGSGEYYLGMLSGMIRYACMTIFFLALLNAPVYSPAEIAARAVYNNQTYGGGLQGYSGDFIPSIDEVQDSVFKKSLLGPQIKNNLSVLLINTSGTNQPPLRQRKSSR
jgi:uncharacterized membrane protein required for colicin V production